MKDFGVGVGWARWGTYSVGLAGLGGDDCYDVDGHCDWERLRYQTESAGIQKVQTCLPAVVAIVLRSSLDG